jgi:hypothetical protein
MTSPRAPGLRGRGTPRGSGERERALGPGQGAGSVGSAEAAAGASAGAGAVNRGRSGGQQVHKPLVCQVAAVLLLSVQENRGKEGRGERPELRGPASIFQAYTLLNHARVAATYSGLSRSQVRFGHTSTITCHGWVINKYFFSILLLL